MLGPGVLVQFDEREFAGPVDRHKHVELALLGAHFGHVHMEEANGICAELAALGLVTLDLWQPGVSCLTTL